MPPTADFARASVAWAVPSFSFRTLLSSAMIERTSAAALFHCSSLPWYSSETPSAVKSAIAALTCASRVLSTVSSWPMTFWMLPWASAEADVS